MNRVVLREVLAAGQKQLLKRTLLMVQCLISLVIFRIIHVVVLGTVGPRQIFLFIA